MAKQNKIKLYARALAEVILEKNSEGPERSRRTVENFVKLLVAKGQERKAKEIVQMAEDLLLRKQGKNKITFEIARAATAENRALLKKLVKDGDVVAEKINHQLIAGVKIVINNEKQFDNSMLNKLNNIL